MAMRGLVRTHGDDESLEEEQEELMHSEHMRPSMHGQSKPPQKVSAPQTQFECCRCDEAENTDLSAAIDCNVRQKISDKKDLTFQRIVMTGEDWALFLEDVVVASNMLRQALDIRSRYMKYIGQQFPQSIESLLNTAHTRLVATPSGIFQVVEFWSDKSIDIKNPWDVNLPNDTVCGIKAQAGVYNVYKDTACTQLINFTYPDLEEFSTDLRVMMKIIADGPLKTFCFRRLSYLTNRFEIHKLLNNLNEINEQRTVQHRDFYNIPKVDNNLQATTCMNHKQLLTFIKKKLKNEPNAVVAMVNGKPLTLAGVFADLNLAYNDLSVDMLDMGRNPEEFSRSSQKNNLFGETLLRQIFLKVHNYSNGKYFAEMIKGIAKELEESKYQSAEIRILVSCKSQSEWSTLAKWAVSNNIFSLHISWVIQLPRAYDVYRSKNIVQSFQEYLDNIFLPLFQATRAPQTNKYINQFLKYVSSFDSLDDESRVKYHEFDVPPNEFVTPDQWTTDTNPSYGYYLYYIYANLVVLNQFRRDRGMNTFKLRPQCGSSGLIEHLVFGYMLAENITHGLQLRKSPVLEYLYYLTQIGVAMSPLRNNASMMDYAHNPLPSFLSRGLVVSLATDTPFGLHFTKEPLMEEYSIAKQVWKLSFTDMAEIARNSVLMSGFSTNLKKVWLGPKYLEEGAAGNNIKYTNLPDIRVCYRDETRLAELQIIFEGSK